jgi:hypothetical protein
MSYIGLEHRSHPKVCLLVDCKPVSKKDRDRQARLEATGTSTPLILSDERLNLVPRREFHRRC